MKKNHIPKALYILIVVVFTLFTSCKGVEDSNVINNSNLELFSISTELSNSSIKKKSKSKLSGLGISLVSWNIRDLGESKDENEIYQIAQILRDFDVIAIQEVVAKDPKGAQAIAKIADYLNRMGSKWDYRISDPTQSPSVYISERYAFLWKTSRIQMLNAAYLDNELANICDREPFIGLFKHKKGNDPFWVVNFHSRRFDNHPEEEIKHFVAYPKRLQTNRVIIAGDFNLDEKHEVWQNFYASGFKNALSDSKTTLKLKCKNGSYTNHAIDNIFGSNGISIFQSGKIDFVQNCESLKLAREISDHLPVYIEFK